MYIKKKKGSGGCNTAYILPCSSLWRFDPSPHLGSRTHQEWGFTLEEGHELALLSFKRLKNHSRGWSYSPVAESLITSQGI